MLSEIFQKPKPILGKIQLMALPGAPGWDGQWEPLTVRAEQEATALATGGVDGLILENAHDAPFSRGRMDTAGAIAMALLVRRLKQFTNLPIGLSVLSNDPETALAIAVNTQADFIRLSVLSGALITESGVLSSRFNELLHYRNRLKAELPPLLVDLSLKHLSPSGMGGGSAAEQKLAHLRQIAETLPVGPDYALIVSSEALEAAQVSSLQQSIAAPLLIEHQTPDIAPDAYFQAADGLILDAGIRKSSVLQPGLFPTIDMPRVEEIINRLREVPSVADMDPDVFLKRS